MVKKRIKVPLAEIKIDSHIHKAVKNTLNSGKYILEENTENFENKFAMSNE